MQTASSQLGADCLRQQEPIEPDETHAGIGHQGAAASPDGRYLAGTDIGDLWIFDIKDGFSLVHHTHDHSRIIKSIAWNNEGTFIASAGYYIWIFDLIQNTSRKLSITDADSKELFWSEDDSNLINLRTFGKLQIIDVTTGELIKSKSIAGRIRTGDILYPKFDSLGGHFGILAPLSMPEGSTLFAVT